MVHVSGSTVVHSARTLWSSAELDLAVLKVEGGNWVPMSLAEDSPKKGAPVYALGFPRGADSLSRLGIALDATVTRGVLSRSFKGAWQHEELTILQHSADINPGNSGGPLLDECGRVIGINTLRLSAEVEDSDGKTRIVPINSGIFWAASILELAAALDGLSIRYLSDASECLGGGLLAGGAASDTKSAEGKGQELGARRWWPVFIGFTVLALLLSAAFVMRRFYPTFLQRKENAPLSLRSPVRGKDDTAALAQGTPVSGLVLSGFDAKGLPIRILLYARDIANHPHGVVLGRHPGLVDFTIDGREVSRRHLRIECSAKKFTIGDLNSANGSRLNGKPLKPYRPRRIRQGDHVSLGNVELRVSAL